MVRITLRQRERLGLLRAADGLIILDLLNWPDEIREPELPILEEPVRVRVSELEMAKQLIGTLRGKFDPAEYSDDYARALGNLVQAKVTNPKGKSRRRAHRDHLTEQLRISLAQAKEKK